MPLNIQQGRLSTGLNIAQAASYATIAAQKHNYGDPIYTSMTRLVDRLVDMALIELEEDKAEQPLPERTDADTVQ